MIHVVSNKFRNWFFIVVLSIVVFSCAQQEIDNQTTEQEIQIESYISGLGALEVVVNDGVWRAVMERGEEGEENKVAKGDSIIFNYAGYVFRSGKGNLYDTNVFLLAETLGTTQDYNYFVPREGIVGKGRLISGLDIGLIGAQVGERCYVIFSSRHGFAFYF